MNKFDAFSKNEFGDVVTKENLTRVHTGKNDLVQNG